MPDENEQFGAPMAEPVGTSGPHAESLKKTTRGRAMGRKHPVSRGKNARRLVLGKTDWHHGAVALRSTVHHSAVSGHPGGLNMRFTILILLAAAVAAGQNPVAMPSFPATPTDAQLYVASNEPEIVPTLTSSVNNSTSTWPISDCPRLPLPETSSQWTARRRGGWGASSGP